MDERREALSSLELTKLLIAIRKCMLLRDRNELAEVASLI